MAHWAKLDENNIVIRVSVGDNNDLDEGYQWLMDNDNGRWIKTSYNTFRGKHVLGGIPLRGNYAGLGYKYYEDIDAFMCPPPYPSWRINTENYSWEAPSLPPDSGIWVWDEDSVSWTEFIYE